MQFLISCFFLPLTPWAYVADFLVDLRYSSRPGRGCLHSPDVSISPTGNIGVILATTNLCYLYLFCPHLGLTLSSILHFSSTSVLNYISKSTEELHRVSEIFRCLLLIHRQLAVTALPCSSSTLKHSWHHHGDFGCWDWRFSPGWTLMHLPVTLGAALSEPLSSFAPGICLRVVAITALHWPLQDWVWQAALSTRYTS